MDGEQSRSPSSVRSTQPDSAGSSDVEEAQPAAQAIRISVGSLFSAGSSAQQEDAESPGSSSRELASVQSVGTQRSTAVGAIDGTMVQEVSSLDEHLPTDRNEIMSWHPNRLCAALVQFVASRVDQTGEAKRRRRLQGKTFDPVATVLAWTNAPGTTPASAPISGTDRKNARRFFVKVLGRLLQRPQRALTEDSNRLWRPLRAEERNQWSCLQRIVIHERVQPRVTELTEDISRNWLQLPTAATRTVLSADQQEGQKTREEGAKVGYGYVVTYNTKLGQDDPEVIKAVQSGATGHALRQALSRLPVYHEAFEDLWVFANTLADSKKFGTVSVALEHSPNGDHKARVHFHIFIGIDLSKGLGFAQTPKMRSIPSNEFKWRGLLATVSPTMTTRKGWSAIYQAVATGAYYVAGPKETLIMKRSTLEPITDSNASTVM